MSIPHILKQWAKDSLPNLFPRYERPQAFHGRGLGLNDLTVACMRIAPQKH